MAFGFPAHARGEARFPVTQEELLEGIRDTLQVLEWPYEEPVEGEFHARRGMGIQSYGERVEIVVDVGGTVRVHSRCVWPLQCIDWGKNAQNVDTFFSRLTQLLS